MTCTDILLFCMICVLNAPYVSVQLSYECGVIHTIPKSWLGDALEIKQKYMGNAGNFLYREEANIQDVEFPGDFMKISHSSPSNAMTSFTSISYKRMGFSSIFLTIYLELYDSHRFTYATVEGFAIQDSGNVYISSLFTYIAHRLFWFLMLSGISEWVSLFNV